MKITAAGWNKKAITAAIQAGDLVAASDLITRSKDTAVSRWLLLRRTNEEQVQLIVRHWVRNNYGMDRI